MNLLEWISTITRINDFTAVGLEDAICLSDGINCVLRSGHSGTVVEITNAVTLAGRLIGNLYI